MSIALARDCGVTIRVVDEMGAPVPYRVSSFKSAEGRDEVPSFSSLSADKLLCGTYNYELSRSDVSTSYGRISGKTVIEDRHQVLTLAADPSLLITTHGVVSLDRRRGTYTVTGTVTNLPAESGVTWIRLIELPTSRFREVEVGADGSFEIYAPNPGEYVILVLQQGRMLASQYVVIRGRPIPPPPITIRVGTP